MEIKKIEKKKISDVNFAFIVTLTGTDIELRVTVEAGDLQTYRGFQKTVLKKTGELFRNDEYERGRVGASDWSDDIERLLR